MFKIPNKQIEVLGEKLDVKRINVSKMLEYRKAYDALGDDDLSGLAGFMRMVIKESVVQSVSDADLDALDIGSLREVFGAVTEAAGMASGKVDANKTT